MNYTNLKAASIAYADRYDTEVSDNIDTFFAMVESRLNRLLRVYQGVKRATLETVASQQYYALPTGFVSLRDIQIETSDGELTLDLIPPSLGNSITSNDYDRPTFYSIVDNQIQLYPTPADATTLEIVYHAQLTGLSTSNATNWIGDLYPDVYLAGLMFEISAFVKDKDSALLWDGRFLSLINEMNEADQNDRWSGPTMSIKTI